MRSKILALQVCIIDAKQMWMQSFIHLTYLVRTYYVSGTFLGLNNIVVNKI